MILFRVTEGAFTLTGWGWIFFIFLAILISAVRNA